MSTATPIPTAPLVLGLGGLIPFWGLTLGLVTHGASGVASTEALDFALATYAAVILSFLGGVRWGFAVRDGAGSAAYAKSVAPSLMGWALMSAPEPWRLGLLGLTVLVLGPIDLAFIRDGAAPAWFGRLRIILATGAGVALLSAALAVR